MDVKKEVINILNTVLNLGARTAFYTPETRLLGSVPELDSMAVVSVITSLEERFGFTIDDDDIDGSTFATIGSLVEFVNRKLAF